ncbi:hypothetical protein BJX63DRAFT_371494 [Aspergillus granulosus]|uniref:C2H2-type domain-containing protein n=1 Tax=Aspergillus granulosus TaxID=176169 RepID=A0ABR4H104_9EURO
MWGRPPPAEGRTSRFPRIYRSDEMAFTDYRDPSRPASNIRGDLRRILNPELALPKLEDPLNLAIDTVSEATLRDVFKSLCKASHEARRLATERLLVDESQKREAPESEAGDPEGEAEEQEPPTTPAPVSLKRPISRYATCQNCEKEFDVTTNTSKSCTYHPEDSEPTEEMYVDVYDDEFDVDTPEMRKDFPDRFEYQCCGSTIEKNPDGCETDWHRAVPEVVLKRPRFCLPAGTTVAQPTGMSGGV